MKLALSNPPSSLQRNGRIVQNNTLSAYHSKFPLFPMDYPFRGIEIARATAKTFARSSVREIYLGLAVFPSHVCPRAFIPRETGGGVVRNENGPSVRVSRNSTQPLTASERESFALSKNGSDACSFVHPLIIAR